MPKDKLNPKQELFCKLYASSEEFFGNGTRAYVKAYKMDDKKFNWEKVASSSATRLLGNPSIIARVNELLVQTGLNDSWVDKQLSFVITQHADFSSKIAAIREYNKLKGRIIEKSQVTVKLPKPIYGGKSTNNN